MKNGAALENKTSWEGLGALSGSSQAGKGQIRAPAKLWTPQWIEQAGKGVAEVRASRNSGPERTPAESQLKSPGFKRVSHAGARSGQ